MMSILHQRHHSDPQVVYTDAAEHDHKASMTAVVTDEYGTSKKSCSIIGTIPEDPEEAAIALAITTADVRKIVSTSKAAIRNFACGRISPSAHRILEGPQEPHLKIALIWTPAHSGLPGNLATHTLARELIYRAREITGQEMASRSRDSPQIYQEITSANRLSRTVYPPAHKSLTKTLASAL